MRVLAALVIALASACSSYSAHLVDGGGGTCAGSAFDPCTANDQCMSMNCHAYNAAGFSACTQACTPGDSTSCPLDSTGAHATCNMMGICKPARANDCTP